MELEVYSKRKDVEDGKYSTLYKKYTCAFKI